MSLVRNRKLASASLSIVGMASVTYLLGAVVMFFQLPSSGWLAGAFVGARIWFEHKAVSPEPSKPDTTHVVQSAVDRPGETYDGFTFYTCASTDKSGPQAFLLNMRREVVHRWAVRFSQVWPNPTHTEMRPNDSWVCFFGSHLYPNGDLVVVFHDRNLNGCGLAKLDKESNVLWAYPAAIHHDVDVAEDGTIYALKHEMVYELPPGLEGLVTPCAVDYLIALTPDGQPLRHPIPILTAFHDSPYSIHLAALERPVKRHQPPAGSTAPQIRHVFPDQDALHTNCVRVLRRDLAAKFPNFKAGHVLISVRNLSVVAMIDPQQGRVVWATRGPWLAQHDPQFLDNGHLLIFDNLGSPKSSRVLEYDPRSEAVLWSYSGEDNADFYTSERGMNQRLPNGNTFIVNSERGEMFEVNYDKKVVWSCALDRFITTARRYSAEQLPFLGHGQPARP